MEAERFEVLNTLGRYFLRADTREAGARRWSGGGAPRRAYARDPDRPGTTSARALRTLGSGAVVAVDWPPDGMSLRTAELPVELLEKQHQSSALELNSRPAIVIGSCMSSQRPVGFTLLPCSPATCGAGGALSVS